MLSAAVRTAFPFPRSKASRPVSRRVPRGAERGSGKPPRIAEPFLENLDCNVRFPVCVELPNRKAKAAFGAVQPEHLPALPLGVDRYARRPQERRKSVGAEHVFPA
jgi:hypothetical protein